MRGPVKSPTFDVFSGFLEKDAKWLESIEGLGAATQRMFQFSVIRPGPYFVFDLKQHKVLASTDTSPKPKSKPPKRRSSKEKQIIDDVA
jgi:hypothetical protein